jgi:hypothetical protein
VSHLKQRRIDVSPAPPAVLVVSGGNVDASLLEV